jgi:high-affinity Fe2+/Pb2+ permease
MTVWERHAARQRMEEKLRQAATATSPGLAGYGLIVGAVLATLLFWWIDL